MKVVTATIDKRFSIRTCPACGSDKRRPVFNLNTYQFCSVNPTYDEGFLRLLQLEDNDNFPIDRCLTCNFVYARLLPDADFLKAVYEEVVTFQECRQYSENGLSYARRMRYIATSIDLCAGQENLHALDFGCGLGVTLRLLHSVNVTVIGYDPSPMRGGAINVPDLTVLRRFDQIEALEEKFDIVICDNVLEHVPEPLQTIKSIAALCKPGSVLFVSVPGYEETFIKRQLEAIDKGEMIDITLNPWEHLNYFNLSSLDSMLLRAGFEAVKASELPEPVNIGLRPEITAVNRLKNGLASMLRMIRYLALGETSRTVEHSFYRFSGI